MYDVFSPKLMFPSGLPVMQNHQDELSLVVVVYTINLIYVNEPNRTEIIA